MQNVPLDQCFLSDDVSSTKKHFCFLPIKCLFTTRGAFPTLDWAPSRSSLRGRTARGKDAARGSSPSRSGGPKTKRPQTKDTPLDREAARRAAGVMTRPQNAPKRTSRTRVFPRACFVRFPLYLLPVAQRGSSNRPRPTTKRPPTADPRPQT